MKEKNKNRDVEEVVKNKVVVITGAVGSIGSEILRQVCNASPAEVRVFDNRETELFYTYNDFVNKANVIPIFGDIRDEDSVKKACNGADIIFHTAAMKHVLVCEWNPFEAIKTNVIGTQNLIQTAVKSGVEKMIMISTDKAVNPTNVMGATKLLAERLVSAACNLRIGNSTKFSVVRFGNVLASRGSVLEIWEKQLVNGEKITVTNPNMTRFFMSIPRSVELIFNAAKLGEHGEIFILKMPSVRIGDLAEAYLELKNYDTNWYRVVGARPGEKLHEELINKEEMSMLLENEKMFVRLPTFSDKKMIDSYKEKGFWIGKGRRGFSSADPENIIGKREIKRVLLHDLPHLMSQEGKVAI
ncbi:MAG: polysaccharide biosynthesis protein [Candidatus Odinarchaeota archaeon]|nr:polysaccharide biosynthesis protein [Candidatus Odinarchaeota archaeon]